MVYILCIPAITGLGFIFFQCMFGANVHIFMFMLSFTGRLCALMRAAHNIFRQYFPNYPLENEKQQKKGKTKEKNTVEEKNKNIFDCKR